jgi:K+-transporting ATPase C subunit
VDQLHALLAKHTEGRQFGFLGEARVNVLELNLELDELFPANKQAAAQSEGQVTEIAKPR